VSQADDDVFSRFICVPKNLSTEQVLSEGKKQFPVWKYTEKPLDNVLNLDFGRDAKKESYIVRVKKNWEADENLKSISANQIEKRKIDTITLKEYILLHRFVYWKHKKHLDIENWTLCSGSRFLDGDIPYARWYPGHGKFRVDWDLPDGADADLRAREVVS